MMQAVKTVARDTRRYAVACPLLFLLPAAVEAVQHAAEWRLGFYDSLQAARQAEREPLRMVLGHAKVLTMFLTALWMTRFLAFNDRRLAWRIDAATLRLYSPVIAWGVFWLIVVQDGPIMAAALGAPDRPVAFGLLALMLATMAFEPSLSAWKVSTAVGDPRIGFVRSVRLVRGSFWWALGLAMLVSIPLIALHYALSFAAIGRGPLATGAILLADSLFVSVIGAAMTAATYTIAQRMTARRNVTIQLNPGPTSTAKRTALPA